MSDGEHLCVVIQGNIRIDLAEIVAAVSRFADSVVVSTWEENGLNLPKGQYELVRSRPPPNPGIGNRNLQRVSTAAGIRCGRKLGADFVLKWRSDLLPLKMTKADLMRWATTDTPGGFQSRLVMSPFRQLGVDPDWFSSFPDLYAFGHISLLEMLWSTEGFDFTRSFNVPPGMRLLTSLEIGVDSLRYKQTEVLDCFDTHIECYAWFKEQLEQATGVKRSHAEVALDLLALPDHRRFQICWLGKTGFRSITQALDLAWYTEAAWREKELPVARPLFSLKGSRPNFVQRFINGVAVKRDMLAQAAWMRAARKTENR